VAKILSASCQSGSVTTEGYVISPATILSQGVKASTGIALIEQDQMTYVTSNASDIKDLITNLESIISDVVSALTGIDAVTTAPGSNAALISAITAAKAAITTQKDNLK